MTTTLLITCISAIASLTAAIASVIGALRRKKIEDLQMQLDKDKAEVLLLKNELYRVYINVSELLEIEKELSDELDIGKKTTRKGRLTDCYIQPKRVQRRIQELSNEFQ